MVLIGQIAMVQPIYIYLHASKWRRRAAKKAAPQRLAERGSEPF
jgi:hypothetical protein